MPESPRKRVGLSPQAEGIRTFGRLSKDHLVCAAVLTYRLGPDDGTLAVHTKRGGAAAMAGHNLLMHVTKWNATIALGGDTRVELDVDGSSLKVIDGSGGMQALQDEDKENIEQTIDDEVLKGRPVTFRSNQVKPASDAAGLHVEGDLTLMDTTRPITFYVAITADGGLRAAAVVKQTDWGMKPYTGLFGALKVLDDVEIELEATLPEPQSE
jgi:polyisoprenoid-binding protein YceI